MDDLALTPFHFRQEVFLGSSKAVLDMPYPLRSLFRSRLGEGSVRRLSAFALLLIAVAAILTASPLVLATEPISANSDALVRAVRAHIAAFTAWRETEIEVRNIANCNRVELPPGDLGFRVMQKNMPAGGYHNLMFQIEACQDGKAIRSFWIMADVTIRAKVLGVVRRVPYGSPISAEDVKETLFEIASPRTQYLRSLDEVAGKIARRPLSPGDPLTRECIVDPVLVRIGDTVRLRLNYGSVSLATLARAEQNGRLGQVIQVRNLDFSRPVRAEVTGRGEVTIE